MNGSQHPDQTASNRIGRWIDVLIAAAWFGLVTGLLEGVGLLALQALDWMDWTMSLVAVSIEIIWISAVFDLLLFSAAGLALFGIARPFPKVPALRMCAFQFGLLGFLDLLLISGRIRHFGAFVFAVGLAVTFNRWLCRHEAAALRFWRRTLPWVAGTAALALVCIQGGLWLKERLAVSWLPAARPGAPNILVIVVDTLRADHLSSYGYSRPTSSNLDRIAQQGVLFENAIATSSWTPPSHASLLTGRYPHEHGTEEKPYDGRYPTIAQALRDRGYRTGAFSANVFLFCRRAGFGRGFIHFEDYFHSAADMAARTLYGRKLNDFVLPHLGFEDVPGRKRAADINRNFLRWVEREPGVPFFAFLNYFDVHEPYLPPQPYRSRFSMQRNPGGILNALRFRRNPKLTPEQLQGERDAYDGGIAYVDEQIRLLLAELERRGLIQDTLVVITSDHGESLGEHGLFLHRNGLYLNLIHVPLVFYWPGHLPRGERVAQPVSGTALPATLMEMIGAGDQTLFPGPSLARLWENPAPHPEWPLPLAEMARFPFEAKSNPAYHGAMKSLVSSRWHYIVHEKFGPSLYDWQSDAQELHDLANTEEGHGVVEEFRLQLQTVLAQARRK